MSQEFIQRYVCFSSGVPREARLHDSVRLRGRVLNRHYRPASIAVFYEPLLRPMSVAALNATRSYGLPDGVAYEHPALKRGWHYPDGTTGTLVLRRCGGFECKLSFRRGVPGLYTICVWIDAGHGVSIEGSHVTVRVRA
jgi:hypothetical protein